MKDYYDVESKTHDWVFRVCHLIQFILLNSNLIIYYVAIVLILVFGVYKIFQLLYSKIKNRYKEKRVFKNLKNNYSFKMKYQNPEYVSDSEKDPKEQKVETFENYCTNI